MSIQNFIPEIWNAAIMEALYEKHIFAQPSVVNRDYEGEIKSQGDTVHITGIEPVTIDNYYRYQDIVFEEIDLNTRAMYIDQAKYFALAIDDIDKWQAKGNVMPHAMKEAGYKLAREVDLFIAGKMSAGVDSANVIPSVSGGGTNAENGEAIREAFVQLRTRLARNNVPDAGRWAIVSPEVYALLLLDPHFIKADERGSTSVVEVNPNGVVGQMYGFSIMESNNAPTDGTTHTILAGNNTAFSFAEALTEVEPVRFEKSFGDGVKGLHVYGGKMIRPEGLCKIDVTSLGVPAEPVTFRDEDWVGPDHDASRFRRELSPSHTAGKTKPGHDELDANSDDISDVVLDYIKVSPKTSSVADGATRNFTATAHYTDGSTATVTTTAVWHSSATSKATIVSNTGVATGVDPGTTVITATYQGKADTANLTVTA